MRTCGTGHFAFRSSKNRPRHPIEGWARWTTAGSASCAPGRMTASMVRRLAECGRAGEPVRIPLERLVDAHRPTVTAGALIRVSAAQVIRHVYDDRIWPDEEAELEAQRGEAARDHLSVRAAADNVVRVVSRGSRRKYAGIELMKVLR